MSPLFMLFLTVGVTAVICLHWHKSEMARQRERFRQRRNRNLDILVEILGHKSANKIFNLSGALILQLAEECTAEDTLGQAYWTEQIRQAVAGEQLTAELQSFQLWQPPRREWERNMVQNLLLANGRPPNNWPGVALRMAKWFREVEEREHHQAKENFNRMMKP